MAYGPKEYRAHAESCLRRARTVRNPLLADEFAKLAKSWLRLAQAAERGSVVVPLLLSSETSSVPRRWAVWKRRYAFRLVRRVLGPICNAPPNCCQ